MLTWNACFFPPAMGRMTTLMDSISSSMEKTDWRRDILPLSILEISRMSLIRPSRWLLAAPILRVYSRTFTALSGSRASRVEKPMTAFMGVQMSWLMLERKVDFASLASCAICSASRSWRLCWASIAAFSLAERVSSSTTSAAATAVTPTTAMMDCTGWRRTVSIRETDAGWRLPALR